MLIHPVDLTIYVIGGLFVGGVWYLARSAIATTSRARRKAKAWLGCFAVLGSPVIAIVAGFWFAYDSDDFFMFAFVACIAAVVAAAETLLHGMSPEP